MDLALSGSVVVITGASGGIGWACATMLAREGASLVLVAGSRLVELEQMVAEAGFDERALCLAADVRDAGETERVFLAAEARFGRVDAVVACAGVWPVDERRADAMDVDQARRTLDINLGGAFVSCRALMKSLGRCGPRGDGAGASIVLVGSTAGRFGEAGHADYAMSKAGLTGLMLSIKNEIVALDPWARVNLVEPGWTATPMAAEALEVPGAIERTVRTMPLAQIAHPDDVASAVAFFLSPRAARHLSGQTLTVAGGMEGRVLREEAAVDRQSVLRRLAKGGSS